MKRRHNNRFLAGPKWVPDNQAAKYIPGHTMFQPLWGYELWLDEQLKDEADSAAIRIRYANGETISASLIAHAAIYPSDSSDDE